MLNPLHTELRFWGYGALNLEKCVSCRKWAWCPHVSDTSGLMQSPSVEGNGRFLTDCNVSRNSFSCSCNCFATIRPPSGKAVSCSLMAAVIWEPSAAVSLDSLWFFPLPEAEKTLHCSRSGFWACHSLKTCPCSIFLWHFVLDKLFKDCLGVSLSMVCSVLIWPKFPRQHWELCSKNG